MFNFFKLKKRRSIIPSLLSRLKVPFTDIYLNELIKLHPNAGNLLGVSDILYQYNVENISLKLDTIDLLKLEPPFLAQMDFKTHHEFAVVTTIDYNNVEYLNEKGSTIKLLKDEFSKLWSGVVLLPETSEKSCEQNFVLNQRKQFFDRLRLPFIISILLCIIAWLTYDNFAFSSISPINNSILILLYITGCTVSVLLLIQTIDKNNPFVNKICALAKTNSHCNDVLESPAAKLFGIISWSEVGFVFFAGNLLCLLFVPQVKDLLFWINISALPYTVWSVYYQGKIAKQWCVFCLSIQILLWICFIALLTSGISFSLLNLINIPYNYLLQSIACFTLPVMGLWFSIPFIKKAHLLSPAMQELNRIKANEHIFEAILKAQKKVEIDENVNSIAFGNPEAAFVITMVTNPYCGPCALMHQKLEALLMQYSDFLGLNIIYAVSNYEADDNEGFKLFVKRKNRAIKVLIGIYLKYGMKNSIPIYKEWYAGAQNDVDSFIKRYPVDIENTKIDEIMSSHDKWCQMVNIEATPTIYVNGYELPDWHKVEDLKYFIHQ
ncbi:MAG: thioredoxin domain-containing protein [Bacteroidetes bacterium]|nr:thioredoxin domain-containing protein [Bacteroidota bacterium]